MTGDTRNHKSIQVEGLNGTVHLVQIGESLADIASYYYGDIFACYWIAMINNIKHLNNAEFKAGMMLFIPESRIHFSIDDYDKWVKASEGKYGH